ncbi:Flp pilus assembly protein TadG [Salirhabdus euzebyi]|uniref:Flp pilus assembly protein TadG n=1 Tax=Salirhabdus euzebyi TaxID=394506 RepID=A0A841Q4Q1_9BACI|nr:Tad domain-containing protein [Salirhabdus euzebyi]MBB6453322.1 Flp pilus assembly protein TadG [Salirhabdus euzebyi]
MKLFKRLLKEQEGNALVLVAVALVMLLGFTAIVVDGGRLYIEKSQLQKSLDAAVLGAAQELNKSEAEVKTAAINIAKKNGYTLPGGDITVDFAENYVKASLTVNKEMTFAKVINFDNADVYASAKAQLIDLGYGDSIVPIILPRVIAKAEDEDDTIHFGHVAMNTYQFNHGPGNGKSGNYGYLDTKKLPGKGAKEVKDGIMYGTTVEVGKEYSSKTGVASGPIIGNSDETGAFNYRINLDKGKTKCNSATTAELNDCARVVVVPIIQTLDDLKGSSVDVKILGLLPFWIDYVDEDAKITHGVYVPHVLITQPGEMCSTCKVKLVE